MNTLTFTPFLAWLETTALVRPPHPIPERRGPVMVPHCPHTPVAPCVICNRRKERDAAHRALTEIKAEGPAETHFGTFWLTRRQFEYALGLLGYGGAE